MEPQDLGMSREPCGYLSSRQNSLPAHQAIDEGHAKALMPPVADMHRRPTAPLLLATADAIWGVQVWER